MSFVASALSHSVVSHLSVVLEATSCDVEFVENVNQTRAFASIFNCHTRFYILHGHRPRLNPPHISTVSVQSTVVFIDHDTRGLTHNKVIENGGRAFAQEE